jgi:hypothetical protein
MINMALKWHHKNISNKIVVLIEFLRSPNVLFGLFDYDCNHFGTLFLYSLMNFGSFK